MTQEQAKIHWEQHLDSIEKDYEPIMQLHEWYDYYETQEKTQKWRKSAEARKRKSQRKGIRLQNKSNVIKKKNKDDEYKHRILAVKRLSEQGYTRKQICEIAHLPYDFVDTILRGLDLEY